MIQYYYRKVPNPIVNLSKYFKNLCPNKGGTLLEALGFIVIGVIFIVVAISLWHMVSSSTTKSTTAQQVEGMVQDIRTLFQGQTNYNGLTEKLLVDAGIVPSNLEVEVSGGEASIHHLYQQPLYVGRLGPTTGANIEDEPRLEDSWFFWNYIRFDSGRQIHQEDPILKQYFYIALSDLPQDACIELATINGSFDWVGIREQDEDASGHDVSGVLTTPPMSINEAKEHCLSPAEHEAEGEDYPTLNDVVYIAH